jgi:hypothetical protein
MYNTKSINDGLQFISQSSIRTSKTSNKLKNNKYKNKNNKNFILENDEEIIENFTIQDAALLAKNSNETNRMNTNVVGYNSSISELNGVQSNITKQAKIFLDINKKSDDLSLRNKDVKITDGKFARVNNAGLFKLYPTGASKCGIPGVPKTVGFDLLNKSPDDYSVLEDNESNIALYGTEMVPGPSGSYPCSNYAGTNIYVSKPISFNYDTDMVYVGVYNQASANQAEVAGQLIPQSDLTSSTVKQCVTRAMDEGRHYASLSNYNPTTKTGKCHIGNNILASSSNSYRIIERATIFTFSNTSHDAFTFAADGGLYSGTSGSGGNPYITPVISATGGTKVPVAALSPKYGGTISSITASYAFEQGWNNWDNLIRFNNGLIGTIGGSLDTFKKYTKYKPLLKEYSYQKNGRTYKYQQWDWEIDYEEAQVTWPSNGLVYINYKCGNESRAPIYKQVSLGSGFNIGCSELYNKYPSFSMMLSDDGLITIVNNANYDEILYTNSNEISNQIETRPVSIAGANKTMMPWADRPDWVSGSVNRGDLLNAYSFGSQTQTNGQSISLGSKTLTNGQYISSPSGKCRLIFYKPSNSAGRLVLEYSVYNVALSQDSTAQGTDKDNNLIGNGNNYAQYYLNRVEYPSVKSKTAYIDINNGLHEYPDNMIQYDNDYIEMQNFAPYSANGTTVPNMREDGCKIACNNDAACAGYTYNDSICKKYTAVEIYPKGGRIYQENNKMHIRKKKISSTNGSDYSCNKVVNDVDSVAYTSYPSSTNMTTTQKCALGLILKPRMEILETKNTSAVTKGNEIKGFINDIYTNQTKLKDTINTKSVDIAKGIADQEEVKRKIDKYEESNITNTATVSDTEMLLVSDNYKYVLWSIVTVIAGVAAIKTFRSTAI